MNLRDILILATWAFPACGPTPSADCTAMTDAVTSVAFALNGSDAMCALGVELTQVGGVVVAADGFNSACGLDPSVSAMVASLKWHRVGSGTGRCVVRSNGGVTP